jgi:ribose transport system ATP-binding protein
VSRTASPSPALLSTRGLCKRYAATVLQQVDFDIDPGEIHGLVGANGAGKSTLCRILAGLTRPEAGTMQLAGQSYHPRGKAEAEAVGMQMVPQELNLIPTLSVAENLFLNRLPRRCGMLQVRRLRRQAAAALQELGLVDLKPSQSVDSLGVGQQQLLSIAAALARRCRLLILDEPTATLTGPEVDRLFEQLRQRQRQGIGVLYVSHRLEEIQELADRISILRDGRLVASQPAAELTVDAMMEQMSAAGDAHATGQSPPDQPLPEERVRGDRERGQDPASRRGAVALRVRDLSRGDRVRDISFDVHRGERLGLAGLVGAGRTELLRAIYGADPADAGTVWVGEHLRGTRFRHPGQGARAGLALVPEDRHADGLLLSQSVCVNTTLASLARFVSAWGRLDRAAEAVAAGRQVERLDVRCDSLGQPASQLSGGNQQKVVVARWLLTRAEVFLLDEPTRGIDVAARRKLHAVMEQLSKQQKALIIVSSDLEELMQISDRILVLSAGQIAGEFRRGKWSRERILAAAFSRHLRG